ncbi:MAG: RNA polymerase sigma factor [Planctomycetaceae bacterium]
MADFENSDGPDEQLIAKLKGGEKNALVQFIESRRPQLLAFIERSLSDQLRRKVEATDILQEVSISAVGSLEEIDFEERDPFSWLCQLSERRIIDAHRKYVGAQKRSAEKERALETKGSDGEQGGFIELLVSSMTTPSRAFSRNQKELKLLVALESLAPDARDALKMRYVDGLPSKEIAAKIGKTDGATRVLLTRSLARLQEILSTDTDFQSFLAGPSKDE